MLAVDTDVVVRYLTGDDRVQAARARRLLTRQKVFVPTTVLLETEWVLHSLYRVQRPEILAALRRFAGLPTVTLENGVLLEQALRWAEQGMDLTDAIRLASSSDCEAFATFDAKFAKMGRRISNRKFRLL